MTAIRANFGDLLKPGFRAVFFEKFGEYPPEYPKIVNVLKSTRQYEEDSGVTGFGTVPEKTEGVGIVYDTPLQGYDKRYTHKTYGLGFRVTREMWEDDLYGKMRKMPQALGKSMRVSIEQDIANVYNNAFDSTVAGGDGIELCATNHPLVGGGTEQNELSNAADFNEDSLEQALIDIAATTDDRGLPIQLMPRTLLVAPSNNWQAEKVLKSSLDPSSGNNAVNPAKGVLPGGWIVNHYLTDSDAWFILCADHEVNMFFRRRPEFDSDNEFNTEDAMYKATARWSKGFSSPWGIFGSPGI